MGKKDFVKLPAFLKTAFVLLLLLGAVMSPLRARAADLPLATSSPLVGVQFDDRPLSLPVQRNFQMAMLTASSELARSCGKMEAYGWRMSQSEQQRVNQIFTTTVDHLHNMGYAVEAQAPTSVSHDITMFTADRADHHFIFMWSAGELGLVMVLCEASAPLHYHNATSSTPSVQVFQPPQDVVQSTLNTLPNGHVRNASVANFTPVGDWVGGYTCEQGYTGGTLQISHLKGENFDGVFRFYPTPKNPYVPTGRYTVYGQYDRASQRVLINPGKWLERPKNFYNTIMVGSFDPIERTFTAYFQGINGCTSFEAKSATEDYEVASSKAKKHVKKKPKKKVAKKKPAVQTQTLDSVFSAPTVAAPVTPVTPAATNAEPAAAPPPDNGSSIVLPAPAPAAPAPSAPATAAPVPITPPVVAPPAPTTAPAGSAPITPPAQTTAPAQTAPPPQVAPSPTTTPEQATKPSGALEPRHSPKLIQVASGEWFTPTSPQAPPPNYVTPYVPQVQQAPSAPVAVIAPPATTFQPVVPQVPEAQRVPDAVQYNVNVPQVPQPPIVPPAQIAPQSVYFTPTVPQVPDAQKVPDYRPPNPGLQGPPDGG